MKRWGRTGWVGALGVWFLIGVGGGGAEGAKWGRGYINELPDEAFASVEEGSDGTRARHLPHHDAEGQVNLPHLRSAMSRLHQVNWVDPANAGRARQHLLDHYRTLGIPAPAEKPARHRLAPRPRTFRSDARPLVIRVPAPRPPRPARAHR